VSQQPPTNEQSRVARDSYAQHAEHKPSPAWFGGLLTGLTFLSAAWILGYTLLDVPFLEALGAWNYAVAIGCIVAQSVLNVFWHGEPYVRPTGTTPVQKT
jgi:hypothetical protein